MAVERRNTFQCCSSSALLALRQRAQARLQGAQGLRLLVPPALLLAHHRGGDAADDEQHDHIGQADDEGRGKPGRGQQARIFRRAEPDDGGDGERAGQHDDTRSEHHGADDDGRVGEDDAGAQAGDDGAGHRDRQQRAPEQAVIGGEGLAEPDEQQRKQGDRDEESRSEQPVVFQAAQFRQEGDVHERAGQRHGGGEPDYFSAAGEFQPFPGGRAGRGVCVRVCRFDFAHDALSSITNGFQSVGQYNFDLNYVIGQCPAS